MLKSVHSSPESYQSYRHFGPLGNYSLQGAACEEVETRIMSAKYRYIALVPMSTADLLGMRLLF